MQDYFVDVCIQKLSLYSLDDLSSKRSASFRKNCPTVHVHCTVLPWQLCYPEKQRLSGTEGQRPLPTIPLGTNFLHWIMIKYMSNLAPW